MAFGFRQEDAHLRRKHRYIGEGKIAVAYQAQDTVGGVFGIAAQGINEILKANVLPPPWNQVIVELLNR